MGCALYAKESGFWVSQRNSAGTGKPYVLLALEILHGARRGRINPNFIKYRVQRPNIANVPPMNLIDLRGNYRLVSAPEAQPLWDFWRQFFVTNCTHGKNCSTRRTTGHCSTGDSYIADPVTLHHTPHTLTPDP
jgi:hypothetical protein